MQQRQHARRNISKIVAVNQVNSSLSRYFTSGRSIQNIHHFDQRGHMIRRSNGSRAVLRIFLPFSTLENGGEFDKHCILQLTFSFPCVYSSANSHSLHDRKMSKQTQNAMDLKPMFNKLGELLQTSIYLIKHAHTCFRQVQLFCRCGVCGFCGP